MWHSLVSLQLPLPDIVIATDALLHHWAICIQGSMVPISHSNTWSGSVNRMHVALQKLQAVALIMCKSAFQLSCRVVALHLDNITAKAYLYN